MFGRNSILTSPLTPLTVRDPHWFKIIGCLLVLSGLAWPVQLPAQQALREQTALKFIPDDAAFFSSSLRQKQQYEAFINSKAFARLKSLPFAKAMVEEIKNAWSAESPSTAAEKAPARRIEGVIKTGLKADEGDDEEAEDDAGDKSANSDDWSDTISGLKAFWSDPENQALVHLGLDAISNEIFFYGDSTIIGFLKELQSLSLSLNSLGNGTILNAADLTPDNEAVKNLLDALDKLPVPAFVIGFKLSDTALAKSQLARLEKAIREALKDVPGLKDAFLRLKIGASEFLTLKLDGSKVPWDELIDSITVPVDDAPDDDTPDADKKPDDADEDSPDEPTEKADAEQAKALLKMLAAKLKSRSLTISLGIHENYLLFSFGETNAHLFKLSGKVKRLIDRAELAPLLKMADKPLTGISYVSQDVSRALQQSSSSAESLRNVLDVWGEQIGLEEEDAEKLIKDIEMLEADAAKLLPDPGTVVEWQYLTPRGYEAFSYDFGGGDKSFDGSKKLTILEHVGGDPLIVVAGRQKGGIEKYQLLAKSLAALSPHIDSLLAKNLPAPYDEQYLLVKQEFAPILDKLHTITHQQLMPAMADGQSAFVLDARIARTQLHEFLAPPVEPLPIPTPALVYGVSDPTLLKQACDGYFSLLQETVNALNRLYPEQVPAIPLPPPAERTVPDGKLYVYEIPGSEGGPGELAPTGGLGANIAVLSLAPGHAARLLTKNKFTPTGVLARSGEPAAHVWSVNFAGLVGVIQPWVNYGLTVAGTFVPGMVPDETAETVAAFFDIIKCWRGSSGITYFEGKTAVSFSETVFEDLK